jgi:hypothetical protein
MQGGYVTMPDILFSGGFSAHFPDREGFFYEATCWTGQFILLLLRSWFFSSGSRLWLLYFASSVVPGVSARIRFRFKHCGHGGPPLLIQAITTPQI